MGSTVKMYSTGTSAQIDIPMSGDLIGIQWAMQSDADADGDYYQAQVSFRSAASYTTNDDRGVISEVVAQFQLVTSGAVVNHINTYIPLPDIPIAAGERLYLHVDSTGGVTCSVRAILHFSFDIDKVASRRRA